MGVASVQSEFGYAAFVDWYDRYRNQVLEPAMEEATAALDALLTEALSDRELARIRRPPGRIKSKPRTWRKLRKPRYWERIRSIDDIPEIIDDLVGLRLTCTNRRDIEVVQAVLEGIPHTPGRGRIWVDPLSERDYLTHPRESGYRGWHVNLGVTVPLEGSSTRLTCELQVRTLLQDGWGELTHEDTYKKDGELPPLVEVLSKRMADLLSTLDDIAEDLRTELDRLDEVAVADTDDAGDAPDDPTEQAPDAEAALHERWLGLDRPTDLAGLAWELQRDFGAEITDDWFGHRTFKRFLLHAVPEGEISTGGQAYLLPPGSEPDDAGPADTTDNTDLAESDLTASAGEFDPRIPAAARELRRVDRSFPLLDTEQWRLLYRHLAEAWAEVGEVEVTNRSINRLTRLARDQSDIAGATIARRHYDHVVKAMLERAPAPIDPTATDIATAFSQSILLRLADLRIVGGRNRRVRSEVRRWLGVAS